MAGERKVREVLVKWVSDQASLRALLADYDLIEDRNRRLGGSGGGAQTQRIGANQRGALPLPPTAQGGMGGIGGATMAPIGGTATHGMLPGGGSAFPAMVGSLAVTASTVAIRAQTVVIQGQGVQGGGVTLQQLQQLFQSIPRSGGPALLNNYRLGTLLGGNGSPLSAIGGNLLNMLAPIAPYALPAAMMQGAAGAYQDYNRGLWGYDSAVRGAGMGIAAGDRPGVGMAADLTLARYKATNVDYVRSSMLGRNPIINAASFGFGGYAMDAWDNELQKGVDFAKFDEIETARRKGAGLTFNRRAAIKFLAGNAQGVSAMYGDKKLDEQEIGRRSTGAYAYGRANGITRGLDSVFFDPAFQKQIASGTASDLDAGPLAILQSLMGVDMNARPGFLGAMRRGDWGGMNSFAAPSAMSAAYGGSLGGVMGMAPALMAQDQSGALLGKALDALQQALSLQKETRIAGIDMAGVGIAGASIDVSTQRRLYGGAIPSMGTRAGQRGNLDAAGGQIGRRRFLAERDLDLARKTGDPETVRRAEVALQSIDLERDRNELAKTESWRSDAEEVYGYRQSTIGLGSARQGARMERESRFGDYRSVASTERERLGIIDQQLAAEREKLALADKQAIKAAERNEIESRIVTLAGQRMASEFDASRKEFGGAMALAGSRIAAAGTRQGVRYMVGGSLESLGDQASGVSGRRGNVRRIESRIDDLRKMGVSEDNPELAQLQTQLEGEKAGLVEGFGSPYRASYGLRRESRNLDTYSRIASSTFSFQADVRGAAQAQLGLAQKELSEIESKYKREMAMAKTDDERKRITEQYSLDKQSVVLGRALPAQQQLEQGWQDRLVSSVYNQGGNFDMVASSFTQREASQFYGIANRAFGGSKSDVDRYRRSGSLWYQAATAVQSPEGFLNSGMSGGPGATPIEVGGKLDVEIVLRNPGGDVVDRQRTQAHVSSQTKEFNRPTPNAFIGG